MKKTLSLRITYEVGEVDPSYLSDMIGDVRGVKNVSEIPEGVEDALQLAGEAKALLFPPEYSERQDSLHEMSHAITEFAEDARTVAELLMEDRPFTPAARRILRKLRARPKSAGTPEDAEEELKYLKARREYVESLLRADQTAIARNFLELEKSRNWDAIQNVEAKIVWLKEDPQPGPG
jgi:hypothetical protein